MEKECEGPTKEKWEEQRKKYDRGSVYFVQGYSSLFSKLPEPLHRTINKVFKANHILWLCTRMAYKKSHNLGELLQSNLSSKLNENLTSLYYMDRPCNCPTQCKVNSKWPYTDKCRTSFIGYQVRCKSPGKIYIGNTQQYFKKRIGAHLSDVKRLVLEGKKSDSFANHFASLCNSDPKPSPKTLREKMEFSILWQGNPVAVQKSVGTKSCYLCMKDKRHILKGMYYVL